MAGHETVRCSQCDAVISNCRCMGQPVRDDAGNIVRREKPVRYEVCAACSAKESIMADAPSKLPEAAICVIGAKWSLPVGNGTSECSFMVVRAAGDGPRARIWSLPGGTVEAGETPLQAMVREVHEEVGLRVDIANYVGTVRSPEDGRIVHVFVAVQWHYHYDTKGRSDQGDQTEIAETTWMRKSELLAQSGIFRPTLENLDAAGILDGKHGAVSAMKDGQKPAHLMDLGVYDVHVPGAMKGKRPMSSLSRRIDGQKGASERLYDDLVPHVTGPRRMGVLRAKKRNSLAGNQFALPAQRAYPIHDAAHVRNAASRLAQAKKRGTISEADYSKARAAIGRAAKRFGIHSELADKLETGALAKMVGENVQVHARLGKGGRLSVRHMSDDGTQFVLFDNDGFLCRDVRAMRFGAEVDPAMAGIKLKSSVANWADGTPKKLVWLQLAETGEWKGHPAGEFAMTPATFTEIVTNYKRRGLPVPFDMEHASEQPPTQGSIPVTGAPAQGWIHAMENRAEAGLWGLVEWLTDYVRDGIKAGQFAYLSPAIRFGSKDAKTGLPIGARMTSAAITNTPFLTSLPGLAANAAA